MAEQNANQRFVDEATVEPDHIARARAHALELGAAPLSPAIGAQCAVLAASSRALNIVEIGTGAGVSGLWLLHGSPRATLELKGLVSATNTVAPPSARASGI